MPKPLTIELESKTDITRDTMPVALTDHHLLCLGLLAKLYIQARSKYDFTDLNNEDLCAIDQAIESAEKLGLPVSVGRLRSGQAIGTIINQ